MDGNSWPDEKLAKECPVFGDCILCLAKFSIEMNKQILLLLPFTESLGKVLTLWYFRNKKSMEFDIDKSQGMCAIIEH